MKTVMRYICDICNEEYLTESTAVACEGRHITNLSLVDTEYESVLGRGLRFPVRVVLQSSNGEKMIYRAEM